MQRALPAICALALGACADFPQIDASARALPPAGPPPPLLEVAALDAALDVGRPGPAETETLQARAAALQARAAVLRRPLRGDGAIDDLRDRVRPLR